MEVAVVVVIGYIAGSIPFSYIAGKTFAGIDLRDHGSGNLGATNTFRFLGAKIAIPVLIADIVKGFLPAFYAPAIAAGSPLGDHWLMLLAGFGAVLGHMFSPFVRFRGGKGIATTAGAFVAIAPLAVGLTFVVWLTVMLMTRIVSVASLTGAIFLPVCVYVVSRVGWQPYHSAVFAISCAVAAVVVIKHRSNIKRLIAGTEPVLQRHKPENHGTG